DDEYQAYVDGDEYEFFGGFYDLTGAEHPGLTGPSPPPWPRSPSPLAGTTAAMRPYVPPPPPGAQPPPLWGEVPALGRIPRTVMDAYLAAHPTTEPAEE
ncbi:hypothetical protein, partial [Micromonospora sp. RV43]|uniref:hypothetical protein n=1 Tax=Micromonospora sp. RV43 TaxID=1661387 RepID=UPI00064C2D7A